MMSRGWVGNYQAVRRCFLSPRAFMNPLPPNSALIATAAERRFKRSLPSPDNRSERCLPAADAPVEIFGV